MKINAFEGARRIALLVGALWAAGCVGYAVFNAPYASIAYSLDTIAGTKKLVNACASIDGTERVQKTGADGGSIFISLCFPPVVMDDGGLRYLYRATGEEVGKQRYQFIATKGEIYGMEDKHSIQVTSYQNAQREVFTVTDAVVEAATASQRTALIEQWKVSLMILFGGLVFLWVFVAAAGWIVRGFAGIPRGKDGRSVP
jgi:hypothetical protein